MIHFFGLVKKFVIYIYIFIYKGFGENSRVLKWIFERLEGKENAISTPIGFIPKLEAIDLQGLKIHQETMKELFKINKEEWKSEIYEMKEYLKMFGNKVPQVYIFFF